MVTLLTWNLRHGGGPARMPRIALALLELAADVIVLSEFRRTTGGQIAAVLADHGWSCQVHTDPPQGTNGLLVASRAPLRRCPHAELDPNRWLEVDIPAFDLRLGAAHVPCAGSGSARVRFWKSLAGLVCDRAAIPFALAGDLNTGRHRLDERGSTFTCTIYMGHLAAAGYRDAWRSLHPAGRQYSWYSHRGNGYRIDHVLLAPALHARLRQAWYCHHWRRMGLSDHAALAVRLDSAGDYRGAAADATGPRRHLAQPAIPSCTGESAQKNRDAGASHA